MNAWNSDYKSHQGNLGLGRAIAYYTANCVPVLIPLNDTQKYDIAIDKEGLKRVSVKTTQHQTRSVSLHGQQSKNQAKLPFR